MSSNFSVNLSQLTNKISDYLTQLSVKTFITNQIGEYSVNIYAEDALIELCNLTLNAKFKNANNIYKNFPCVDLIDKSKKIAIQITSDSSIDKIKDTIARYFSSGLYTDEYVIYVYFIVLKQRKYSQKTIDEYIEQCKINNNVNLGHPFKFDVETHAIDSGYILKQIKSKADIKYSQSMLSILERQFGKLSTNDDLQFYYSKLKSKYDEVVMNDEYNMRLSDIYVEPNITFHNRCISAEKAQDIVDKDQLGSFPPKSVCVSNSYFNDFFIPQKKHPYIVHSRIALLLGFPGQGKTSFCKRLINDLISTERSKKPIFYFKLKDVPNTHLLIGSPFVTLHETFKQNEGLAIDMSFFADSIVILDGLDELFMKEGLKLDDIEWFCQTLTRDVERMPSLQVIITSRKHYVNLDRILSYNILICQLEPLTFDLQKKWLKKYRQFHPETWLTTRELERKSKTFLGEMMEQPILLHIIATLINVIDSKITRAELYEKLFSQLIERKYSADGQIQILKEIKPKTLRELIQEIAFAIYQTGNGYISKTELLNNKTVQRYLEKFPSNDFRENLKGIMVSFYFNEMEVKDQSDQGKTFVVEFLHKSLEEYMVAEKITNAFIASYNNQDSNGDYIVNDSESSLKVINQLFSNKQLSEEVATYIREILSNIPTKDKEKAGNRLFLFFNEMLEVDFIGDYNRIGRKNPIESSLLCFAGCWSILKNIFPYRNLANEVTSQKIMFYINSIENFFIEFDYYGGISYQKFSNINMWGLSSFLYIDIFDVYFDNCIFKASTLEHLHLVNWHFNHSEFNGVIRSTEFTTCNIENFSFDSTVFLNVTFNNVSFKNVSFLNCYFDEVVFTSGNNFSQLTIDAESLFTVIKMGASIRRQDLKTVVYNRIPYDPNSQNILDIFGEKYLI